MDFTDDEEHRLIRAAIRDICARFPDEYWADLDASHTFPWAFYDAMAKGGWIGIAIPAEFGGGGAGITEASIILEEVAASGACMNGASSTSTTGSPSTSSSRPCPSRRSMTAQPFRSSAISFHDAGVRGDRDDEAGALGA